MKTVRIQHFSDVLCVWAYVAQARIDELKKQFGSRIEMEYHFVNVFGHVRRKLAAQWEARGGLAAYGEHVRGVADAFGHVPVHPRIWTGAVPESCLPAHLFLCAVKLLPAQPPDADGHSAFERALQAVRTAFFRDLVDVSRQSELMGIARALGLPVAEIEAILEAGAAHALLSEDIVLCRDQPVRSSPTIVFNEGRQILTGNVGYRVIEANVRELLRLPAEQASWC